MIAQLLVPSPKQPPLHPPPPSPATTTTLQHPAHLRRHHRTLPPTPLIRRDDFSAPTTSDRSTHFAAFAPPTWFNYLSTFLVRLRWCCCCCCCCCVVNWCLCPVYRGLPNSIGSAHPIPHHNQTRVQHIQHHGKILHNPSALLRIPLSIQCRCRDQCRR